MSDEPKLLELERRTDAITRRLDRLEAQVAAGATVSAPRAWAPPAPTTSPRPAPAPPAPPAPPARPAPPTNPAPESPAPEVPAWAAALDRRLSGSPRGEARAEASLEDLLGGRVLAWLGGIAVLVGVVFLLAIAVSNGWIGEAERTLAAAAASLGLVLVGIRLHERRGRTDASLAATATGIAGTFTTVVVAAQVYELVPDVVSLGLALATGGLATALAVRWEARGIGALGILGALLSPVLAGAPSEPGTLALLFVAGLSAAGVLLWQRWDWLALAAFAVTTPQWIWYLLDDAPGIQGTMLTLVLFGALNVGSAIGFELRLPSTRLRASSSFLLALNACVLAASGWIAIEAAGDRALADLWLAGLAVAHLLVGVASSRLPRVSQEIGLLALALGVALADVAFGVIASGPVLAVGWAGSGALFAWIARRARADESGEAVALLGLGSHVGLALLHALVHDARPELLLDGAVTSAAIVALAAVAAGCLVSARLAAEGREELRIALDVLGLAVAAYLAAIALEGPELVAFWALEAGALGHVARRTGDRVAAWASVTHLAAALAHTVAFEATPDALLSGLDDPVAAAIALMAFALGAVWLAELRIGDPEWRPVLIGATAGALLYLASTAVVTPFEPRMGQTLLSALWSVVGAVALVAGLRSDQRPVRLAGLGLLLVTVAKVFLYDLAALTSLYRVASFVALGLLLLVAAFVWQRLRPRALTDLRETPPAIR